MMKQNQWVRKIIIISYYAVYFTTVMVVISVSPVSCFRSIIIKPQLPLPVHGFNRHRRSFRRHHHHHHERQQHCTRDLSLLQMNYGNDDDIYGNPLRRNITLPLFHWIPSVENNNITHNNDEHIYPLPSAHISDIDLRSLNVYIIPSSMFRDSYIHQKLFDDVIAAYKIRSMTTFSPRYSNVMYFGGNGSNDRGIDDPNESNNPEIIVLDQTNLYGNVVWKNVSSSASSFTSSSSSISSFDSPSSWIGAIGCAVQVAVKIPNCDNEGEEEFSHFFCYGSFRFVVRDIIQSLPYPVALVDELYDDDIDNDGRGGLPITDDNKDREAGNDDEEGNDDENLDIYQSMNGSELVQRIFISLQLLLNQKLEKCQRTSTKEMSPLEDIFVSHVGMGTTASSPSSARDVFCEYVAEDIKAAGHDDEEGFYERRENAITERPLLERVISSVMGPAASSMCSSSLCVEEMPNFLFQYEFDVFKEFTTTATALRTRDYYYTVAMMAAEMAQVSNHVRAKILIMTNGIERLRVILRALDEIIGMSQAWSRAEFITTQASENGNDLKVLDPQMPSWSRQIQEGTRISYYWDSEYGWRDGEVIGNPAHIVTELIVTFRLELFLTVRFDDGQIFQLPFFIEDKARWRLL